MQNYFITGIILQEKRSCATVLTATCSEMSGSCTQHSVGLTAGPDLLRKQQSSGEAFLCLKTETLANQSEGRESIPTTYRWFWTAYSLLLKTVIDKSPTTCYSKKLLCSESGKSNWLHSLHSDGEVGSFLSWTERRKFPGSQGPTESVRWHTPSVLRSSLTYNRCKANSGQNEIQRFWTSKVNGLTTTNGKEQLGCILGSFYVYPLWQAIISLTWVKTNIFILILITWKLEVNMSLRVSFVFFISIFSKAGNAWYIIKVCWLNERVNKCI